MLLAFNRIRELVSHPAGVDLRRVFCRLHNPAIARGTQPIIDLRVFRLPGFAILNIVSVLTNIAAFSVWLLVPYYLTRVSGYALAESGAILASGAAGAVLATSIGGRLIDRKISAGRLAISGAVGVGAGLLMLSAWTEQTTTALRVTGLMIQGVGLGLFQLAYTDIVTAALPLGDRGVAGSLALLTRTLGTVAAASIVLMVFEILNVGQGFFEAFRQTFQLAALLAFASARLLVFAPRRVGKV